MVVEDADARQWPDKYPPLLVDLGDKVARWLINEGISPDRAMFIAMRIADEISDDWGGQQLYIPSTARHAGRNAKIRALRWRGATPRQIASIYGLTPSRIRQICG